MAAFQKFNNFTDYLVKGGMNFSSDTIKLMLTNTAPVATNSVYADVSGTELANGNGYTTGGATCTGVGVSNSSGTETVTINPTTFTSSTGNMGPFRYMIFYNNTHASKPLIGFFDYGSSITLNGTQGDTFTETQSGNVLFTVA